MVNVNGTLPVRHKTQWPYIFMTHPASPRAPSSNQETVGFPGFTHFGSAEDRVITNKAEGNLRKAQQPRGFSWLLAPRLNYRLTSSWNASDPDPMRHI